MMEWQSLRFTYRERERVVTRVEPYTHKRSTSLALGVGSKIMAFCHEVWPLFLLDPPIRFRESKLKSIL